MCKMIFLGRFALALIAGLTVCFSALSLLASLVVIKTPSRAVRGS